MVDSLNDLKPSVREMPIDVFVEALSDEADARRLPGRRLLDAYVLECGDVSRQRFLASGISVQAENVGQKVRIILRAQAAGIALRHHRGHEFEDIARCLAYPPDSEPAAPKFIGAVAGRAHLPKPPLPTGCLSRCEHPIQYRTAGRRTSCELGRDTDRRRTSRGLRSRGARPYDEAQSEGPRGCGGGTSQEIMAPQALRRCATDIRTHHMQVADDTPLPRARPPQSVRL